MIERGRGKILNIASMAGFQPSPLMSIYYATKAYVLSFTQSIANELKGTGVTATVLCPGMVPTGFQQTVGAGRTKFSAKSSWMVTPVEYVAQFGYDAMMRGKSVAIPGAFNVLVAFLVRFVPRDAVTRFLRRAQEKNRAGQAPSKI
jgi:short-subunit dehydrogenase